MISSEFASHFDHFPHAKKFLKGVYASDNLPSSLKVNHFIICNTDVLSGEGIHWYCIFRTKQSELECFDSLGINEQKKNFLEKNFNFKGVQKLKFVCTPVQSTFSNTCGHFVLYFLINRLYNKDKGFNELLNEIFCGDPVEN